MADKRGDNRAKRLQAVAVICTQFRDFELFIKDNVDAEDHDKFIWVSTPMHLEGRRFSQVIRLKTYKDIPNHKNLHFLALKRSVSHLIESK